MLNFKNSLYFAVTTARQDFIINVFHELQQCFCMLGGTACDGRRMCFIKKLVFFRQCTYGQRSLKGTSVRGWTVLGVREATQVGFCFQLNFSSPCFLLSPKFLNSTKIILFTTLKKKWRLLSPHYVSTSTTASTPTKVPQRLKFLPKTSEHT